MAPVVHFRATGPVRLLTQFYCSLKFEDPSEYSKVRRWVRDQVTYTAPIHQMAN